MAIYIIKWNTVYGLNRVFLRYNCMQFVPLRPDRTNNCVYTNFKESFAEKPRPCHEKFPFVYFDISDVLVLSEMVY